MSSESARGSSPVTTPRDFEISLAGWSLHRTVLHDRVKQIDLFPMVRDEFGIDAFELVNTMLEVPTAAYVGTLRKRAEESGVSLTLIMIDQEGPLGDEDPARRDAAVVNHAKWLPIAHDLGCRTVRVNWAGGSIQALRDPDHQRALIERSIDSYRRLADRAAELDLNLVIENHWGPSSYPNILVPLIQAVDRPNFGTLPDFGNFPKDVDRYEAVDMMMPYAKAVSAKCKEFDAAGNVVETDYKKMLGIVCDKHGYSGQIGIEYEGTGLSEKEGILACKKLLERLRNREPQGS